ncbi:hypothetical protein [Nocardioides marmoraquaticus]
MTTGIALDPVPLLLHAAGAAALALAGVGAARWLGVVRGLPSGVVDRLGWALGVAAVAVGGLAVGTWYQTRPVTYEYSGSYAPLDDLASAPLVGGASPWWVVLGVPLLALGWAAAAARGRASYPAPDRPVQPGVQAGAVWLVTLPLQAALCAWDVQGGLVLLGAAVSLAGIVATAAGRPTATDVGDVLAAVGTWLVAAAAWPGGWTYSSPVVVVVLRRRAAAS